MGASTSNIILLSDSNPDRDMPHTSGGARTAAHKRDSSNGTTALGALAITAHGGAAMCGPARKTTSRQNFSRLLRQNKLDLTKRRGRVRLAREEWCATTHQQHLPTWWYEYQE